MSKLRWTPILCLGSVVLVLAFAAQLVLQTRTADAADVGQDAASYSPMLKFLTEAKFDSQKEDLRLPTESELKDFGPLWPKVPLTENAAYYYEEAVRLLHWEDEPPGSLSGTEPYAGDMKAFAAWIASNRASLDMVRKAEQFDACQFPIFVDARTGMRRWSWSLRAQLRQLVRNICDAAFLEELRGNPNAAADWYLCCLRMGPRIRQHAWLDLHWSSLSAIIGGNRYLPGLVANMSLSEAMLRRVIWDARSAEITQDDIRTILKCHRAYEMQAVACVRDSETWKIYLQGHAFPYGAKEAPPPEDFARCRKMVGELCDYLLHIWDGPVEKLIEDEAQFDKLLPTEVKQFEPLANEIEEYREFPQRWAMMNTELRALEIQAAIALYQKKNGRLPESLDDLRADILPEIPVDPFSGKPMRYARMEEGGWKVWSVGLDRKDDGGVGAGKGWRGLDRVFTSAVPSNIEARSRKEPLVVGEVAPPFEVKTLDGQTIRLSDYRGKFVLLDFWATWCSICLAETPHLKETHEAFSKDDRFVMISLSLDEKLGPPREYVAKQGLDWIQGFLADDWSLPKQYRLRGVPAIFLIGPDGKVIAAHLSAEEIKAAVAEALRKGT